MRLVRRSWVSAFVVTAVASAGRSGSITAVAERGDGTSGSGNGGERGVGGSALSMGHQHGRMPFFTAGGKNLGVNVGRCLKLPQLHKNTTKLRGYDRGYPHARLLVSLLNAMGLPDTTFGDPDFGNGPIDGCLKTS
jgi:hypothetical protein